VELTLSAALDHSPFQALGREEEDSGWWRHGADAADHYNADKRSLIFYQWQFGGNFADDPRLLNDVVQQINVGADDFLVVGERRSDVTGVLIWRS